MKILGIHFGHDSSACLIIDGKLVGAVEEERFTRTKKTRAFPKLGIKYLLDQAGISPKEIDLVAVAGAKLEDEYTWWNLSTRLGVVRNSFWSRIWSMIRPALKPSEVRNLVQKSIYSNGFLNAEVQFVDHHRAHAATAIWMAPFPQNSILAFTQDGKGDNKSGTLYAVDSAGELKLLWEQTDFESIGVVYSAVTKYLGYKPLQHEGKLTGLAAYGRKSLAVEKMRSLFSRAYREEALKKMKPDFSYYLQRMKTGRKSKNAVRFDRLVWVIASELDKNFSKFSAEDVAFALQAVTEETVINLLKELDERYNSGHDRLCLSGGLFANVRVNERLMKESGKWRDIFVQPAMGDSGLSLGAALSALKDKNVGPFELQNPLTTFFGPKYSNEEILIELENDPDVEFNYCQYIEKEVAQLLAGGDIVARFEGRMEFGPRALGHRSILVAPFDRGVNDSLNERLKRSEFMPFAPSMTEEHSSRYIDNTINKTAAAHFMTITGYVPKEEQGNISAVVHVDGTARPQIVTRSENPSYHKVISEFGALTGCYAIVNTSFNMHEEPIVNSPKEALKALKQNAVDWLAIENYLVKVKQS